MKSVKPSDIQPPINPHDPERFLNPKEVAARLGISVATLYNWRYLGKGPKARKLGRSSHSPTRYRQGDVTAWVEKMPVATLPSVADAAQRAANEYL